MKHPYFVERELPHLVRKYMETHTVVDIDVLTQHLIDEHHKFRHKKFRPFRKSVTEAYKWNYYLMEKEEQKAAQSLKIDTSYVNVKLEDLDGQPATTNDNNGNVDYEIVDSIMRKNRKGEQQVFPTEAPKLVDLQGISSLVKLPDVPLEEERPQLHLPDQQLSTSATSPVTTLCTSRAETPVLGFSKSREEKNYKRRKQVDDTDELMLATVNQLKNNTTVVSAYVQEIAEDLGTLEAEQKIIAKKLIRDVLFLGSLKKLTITTSVKD